MVNLEVVKARARPGADGATIASFAADASSQVDDLARLTSALLGLARPPRSTPDAAAIVRDAVTLLAPVFAHGAVRLEASGDRVCAVGGDANATRLAVVRTLLDVCDAAAHERRMAETAGALPASDLAPLVVCTTRSTPHPIVEVTPHFGVALALDVQRVLLHSGIDVSIDGDVLRLALLPASAS
jgi:hypothetical protein